LGHVDTTSAARDLEAVRAALGEGDLNFLGLSYGSQLGVAYAELFPENIRVMALDGALDHGRQLSETLIGEAAAYETAFERFAQWCAETPDCALHGKDVGTFFDDLVQRADARPIPAPLCQETGRCRAMVTGGDIRLGLQGLILFKEPLPSLRLPGWPSVAEALLEAAAGDASKLSLAVATGEDSPAYAELAIACADWPVVIERYEDLAAKQLLGRVIAPHTQGASQTWRLMTGCLDWPVPVANPPHRAEVSGAPPILIVNSTYDLSTPYIWAHALRDQVEGSVLLTRVGDGHTTYLQPGPSQTRDAIDTYLVTGETPPPNTVYDS
jgi:pimeloyl-ACP methyl ester carboxylesterase